MAKARLAIRDGAPVVDQVEGIDGTLSNGVLTATPIPIALGGTQPALLAVTADETGIRMRLTGVVLRSRLVELGKALPVFGDGLAAALPVLPVLDRNAGKTVEAKTVETPLRLDLAATRSWAGRQVWAPVAVNRPSRRRLRSGSRSDRR